MIPLPLWFVCAALVFDGVGLACAVWIVGNWLTGEL
jgi:hypothetical protein